MPRPLAVLALLLACTMPAAAQAPGGGASPWRCGQKTYCTQMTSCEEAMFHFRQCGLTRLDGDRDSVPCEALCGGSRGRRSTRRR